jgi:hypothetical protein
MSGMNGKGKIAKLLKRGDGKGTVREAQFEREIG